MTRHRFPVAACLSFLALLPSCHEASPSNTNADPAPSSSTVTSARGPAPRVRPPLVEPPRQDHQVDLLSAAMTDEDVGPLIESLSEEPGNFPSDNFVSNETSYLDAASTLSANSVHGRTYIGVGPEQNFTYIAWMQPAMSYIVDIRRSNMLEHLYYRLLLESSPTRYAFLMNLTGRVRSCLGVSSPKLASFEELATSLSDLPARGPSHVADSVRDTLRLMRRLRIQVLRSDRKALTRIVSAFAHQGLALRYSMKGSNRRYPSLERLLTMTTKNGERGSFLAEEDTYQTLRGLVRANRVIPVVGDFAGPKTLRRIGEDSRKRRLKIGVFYMSNVEQYLFDAHHYDKFLDNLKTLPIDNNSRAVRVWFDQGKPHPNQRPGHRTTTISASLSAQLAWSREHRATSYWQVATQRW